MTAAGDALRRNGDAGPVERFTHDFAKLRSGDGRRPRLPEDATLMRAPLALPEVPGNRADDSAIAGAATSTCSMSGVASFKREWHISDGGS